MVFWDIPKGKLEKGETPSVAGAREVEEECGIKVEEIENPSASDFSHVLF